MHQTFYIDVDEEISSVIDRLNKSMSIDNYFVVPKRALFLQSIVNLKILKREADKVGKNIIIVTQDESGLAMAERSGIEVRPTLDGLETPLAEVFTHQDENEEAETEDRDVEDNIENATVAYAQQDKQIRLSNIGSGDYFQQDHDFGERLILPSAISKSPARRLVDQSKAAAANNKIEKPQKIVLKKIGQSELRSQIPAERSAASTLSRPRAAAPLSQSPYNKQLDPSKAKSLEKMFSDGYAAKSNAKPEGGTKQISAGRLKKGFMFFMFFCATVFLGVAAYLFVPSAKITIISNVVVQKVNLDIAASVASSGVSQSNIPLRVFNQDQQLTLPYDVTTQTAVSGKKASGTVVIYNQFSSDPQTLIASTRLQSSDGKIFHIVKAVVVPGSSTVSGQLKPGAIQAAIVADQAGSDYNIAADKFIIPGFAGGPKADKFYAQSTAPMAGGTTDAQQATGTAVSQSDLDSAKQQAETAFKDKINEIVKSQLASGEVALPDAEKITITKSSTLAKVGAKASSIDWTVIGTVQALIFSENDVKTVLSWQQQGSQQDSDVQQVITKIDYGSATPDFDNAALALKVYGEITSTPKIDSNQIKQQLLGKSDDQLSDILKKYSSIKSADVEFNPTFITRIPLYPFRVTVQIQNNTQ